MRHLRADTDDQTTKSDQELPVHLGSDFDSCSSSEEELECQRECDYDCSDCTEGWIPAGRRRSAARGEPGRLDAAAQQSKLILVAFIPILGRQLGSILARRVLRAWYGGVSY